MKKHRLVLTATALLLFVLLPARVQAAGETRLRLAASQLNLEVDQEFTVDVFVEGASSVYGTEVHLSFDPAIVAVTEVTHGDFLAADPDNDAFVLENDADNIEGTVDYALSLLNPAPPAEGNGLLLQVTFQAKSEGVTSIALVESLFGTQTGEEILPAVEGPVDLVVGNAVDPQVEPAEAASPASAQPVELQSTTNGPTRVNDAAAGDSGAVTLLGLSLVAGAILIAGLGLLALAVMIGLWIWFSKSKRKKRMPQAVSS